MAGRPPALIFRDSGQGPGLYEMNNNVDDLAGCCGLYCALCSRYQSGAPSRCIGCKLGEHHSWCTIWNCCVKKRGLRTCAECPELFQCQVFLKRRVSEWVPAAGNLKQIKESGLENWTKEQRQRRTLLESLLSNYNEGRSMSFYCRACTRFPLALVRQAVRDADRTIARHEVDKDDRKSRARILRQAIKDAGLRNGVVLD